MRRSSTLCSNAFPKMEKRQEMESKKVTQAAKKKSPLRIEISETGVVTLSPEMCHHFAGKLVTMRFTMKRNVAQIAFPRANHEQDAFVMPLDGIISRPEVIDLLAICNICLPAQYAGIYIEEQRKWRGILVCHASENN